MIASLVMVLNWSRLLLISAVLMVFASAMSLTASGRFVHRHHKILRMRGGDVVFRSGKGSLDTVDAIGQCGKGKQSVMRFASVAVVKDARMGYEFNETKPLKKSYQYYF